MKEASPHAAEELQMTILTRDESEDHKRAQSEDRGLPTTVSPPNVDQEQPEELHAYYVDGSLEWDQYGHPIDHYPGEDDRAHEHIFSHLGTEEVEEAGERWIEQVG